MVSQAVPHETDKTYLDEKFLNRLFQFYVQCNLVNGIYPLIERNPNKPIVIIELMMHVCVFKLIVAVPTHCNQIFRVMTPQRI